MLASILPNPLHPAIVHLPIALSLILPLVAAGALWAVRTGARPMRAWGVAIAFFAALTLSSWLAVETGEQTGERVERAIGEAPVETHEEAAEAFLVLSLGVLVVALAGLRDGRIGQGARALGTVGALALIAAGFNVGHSGGALVYQHGAASVYAGNVGNTANPTASPNETTTEVSTGSVRERDEDEEDEK